MANTNYYFVSYPLAHFDLISVFQKLSGKMQLNYFYLYFLFSLILNYFYGSDELQK